MILQLRPGQVVVMDTLKAHKAARIREAIEVAQARVSYLPRSPRDRIMLQQTQDLPPHTSRANAQALELPHHHLRDAVAGSRTVATVPRPNELRDEQKN